MRYSCVHVQTFVRSPNFRAFMSRLLCVQQTFVRLADIGAFMFRLSGFNIERFVRSCLKFGAFTKLSGGHVNFCAFSRLSCVHVMSRLLCVQLQTNVRLCPDCGVIRLSCAHVPTYVLSCQDFCAFSRLSCVHVISRLLCVQLQTIVRLCPDCALIRLSCVHLQTFVRALILCLDILASVWDLNLGHFLQVWIRLIA